MDRKTALTAATAAVLTVAGGVSVLTVAARGADDAPPAVVTEYVDQNGNPVAAPGSVAPIVIVIEEPAVDQQAPGATSIQVEALGSVGYAGAEPDENEFEYEKDEEDHEYEEHEDEDEYDDHEDDDDEHEDHD